MATEYLFQPKTGIVYVKTAALALRKDMVPAKYDPVKKTFVQLMETIPAVSAEPVSGPEASPRQPEPSEPDDEDPLGKLTRKELSDLCQEKYGKALKIVGVTKPEVIAEFRKIEAEAESAGQ